MTTSTAQPGRTSSGAGQLTTSSGADRETTASTAGQAVTASPAGHGLDALYTRDDVRDVVACGPDRDALRADREDAVARDCEIVERR